MYQSTPSLVPLRPWFYSVSGSTPSLILLRLWSSKPQIPFFPRLSSFISVLIRFCSLYSTLTSTNPFCHPIKPFDCLLSKIKTPSFAISYLLGSHSISRQFFLFSIPDGPENLKSAKKNPMTMRDFRDAMIP